MSEYITLSKEFGLNPSVAHCECCGKEYGVALLGTNCKDPKTGKTVQAPKDILHGFCNDCQAVIDQGRRVPQHFLDAAEVRARV